MAQRCQYGYHNRCEACGNEITPQQADHIHIFRARGHKDDTLCARCWLICAVASTHLLKALRDGGIQFEEPESLLRFLRTHVAIWVDQQFDFGAIIPN